MELRHLDTLVAIADEGSFTAAADRLATVQSNVSEHVRQLEEELGVELLIRSRRGAEPTECGAAVLERARRIRRELEAMRADLSMLQGLQAGQASLGVVGTASRWLVPELVGELRELAPGIRLRVTEGASERLFAEVANHELAMAVVTEPVTDRRLDLEHVLDEELVGLVARDGPDLGREPVPLARLVRQPMILPPSDNPLRREVEAVANANGLTLPVPIEVEGIRLIADMVAAGGGVSVLPETAIPPELAGVRSVALAGMPPRRLALVTARDAHLSLADRAVRESVLRIVARHRQELEPRARRGQAVSRASAGPRPARVNRRASR
jgi:LysR family transcriptional regulator, nitrogen assimilation regulatory protein